MTDKIKFAELMQFMAVTIKGQELTKIELQGYWYALADEFENIGEFEKAVKKLLKSWNYSYMPKPSHFIEAGNPYDEITLKSIAESAWNSVIEAVENGAGYNKIAEFEDKLILPVLKDFVTLGELGNMSYKEMSFIRKNFIDAYCRAVNGKKILKEVEQYVSFDEPLILKIKANYPVEDQNQKVLEYRENKKEDKKALENLVKIKKF